MTVRAELKNAGYTDDEIDEIALLAAERNVPRAVRKLRWECEVSGSWLDLKMAHRLVMDLTAEEGFV